MKKKHWVLLADSNQCRQLCCGAVAGDRCHVEEHEGLEDDWEGHEHGRPSSLAGKAGSSYASAGHEDDERLHRFAQRVCRWLSRQIESHGIDRVTVFAPPRFLGRLRQTWAPPLSNCVEERREDLMNLGNGQLSSHPAIRRLVDLGDS